MSAVVCSNYPYENHSKKKMNFSLFNSISAFPSAQFLNQNHNTIVFGSCPGVLRKVIDFDLSYRRPYTEEISRKHKTKEELKKKELFGLVNVLNVTLKEISRGFLGILG